MDAKVVSDLWDQSINDYLQIVASVILYFDHLLTFGDEVAYIWLRPKIRSSYWFLLNRYMVELQTAVGAALQLAGLSTSPFVIKHYVPLLVVFNGSLVNFLFSLRIYALYHRSWNIICVIAASHATVIGLSLWSIFGELGIDTHRERAFEQFVYPSGDDRPQPGQVIPWACLLGHDSLMFILLFCKARSVRRQQIHIPLLDLLYRDGVLYYGVVCLAYMANILTFFFRPVQSARSYMQGGLTAFSTFLAISMMSRIILNLHKTSYEGIYSPTLMTTLDDETTNDSTDTDNSFGSGWRRRHRQMQKQRERRGGQPFQLLPLHGRGSGYNNDSGEAVELDTMWSESVSVGPIDSCHVGTSTKPNQKDMANVYGTRQGTEHLRTS
ncbi:hypothetical protein VKT23_005936 [Stygiomarasmius scandens]|uniref:DUF6533 domain-containing protein n=1 Tax=Marasmiellus scandens TaxID=2682957 RepID=A0ABR1JTH6_9AGAR